MTGLIAALLVSACGGAWLDGTFIQYSPRVMAPEAQERLVRDLDAVREAGMRLLIVQRLAVGPRSFIPETGAPDPTELLLSSADKHDMQVFLGLVEDGRWWQTPFDQSFLDELTQRSIDIARKARDQYGKHPSFAGWYIPLETWDVCPHDKIELVAGVFRRIAEGCRALTPDKPVGFAPFYTGFVKPKDFAALYEKFLPAAKLDILMLQDGVGARGWDDKVETVKPYFKAMQKVCKDNNVQLWADVENFTKNFKPCAPERLTKQLQIESPYVSKMVTFEFFHYMSPNRGDAQRAMYEQYMKAKGN
jgi:hypothetical protein